MKDKVSQMFKDKLFLVMLVLGLLTIVAAAGVVTIQRGNRSDDQSPYLEMQEQGNLIAEETVPEKSTQIAGNSNARETEKVKETKAETVKELTKGEINEPVASVGTNKDAAKPLALNFGESSKMVWPVAGNVLLDYNMESTIYFPTLDQYKCNPGIVIQSDVSQPVNAPANAKIKQIGSNEELGNYVVLDLGNEYEVICGQLKELQVVENEYVNQGQLLGYVSEPTKYYSVEGTNVFLELLYQEKAIDPLDYME